MGMLRSIGKQSGGSVESVLEKNWWEEFAEKEGCIIKQVVSGGFVVWLQKNLKLRCLGATNSSNVV